MDHEPGNIVASYWRTLQLLVFPGKVNVCHAKIEDVVKLFEHLNVEQAHILGHSMGGKVAMQLALCYPNLVSSLVVADIAPVTYAPRHHDIFTGLKAIDLNPLW